MCCQRIGTVFIGAVQSRTEERHARPDKPLSVTADPSLACPVTKRSAAAAAALGQSVLLERDVQRERQSEGKVRQSGRGQVTAGQRVGVDQLIA